MGEVEGVDFGVELGDDLGLGVAEPDPAAEGVDVALAVGLGVLVAAFLALGVADGDEVGVDSMGVGVINITSKEGVGGIGEISFCCDLTKKYTPTMTATIRITGIMKIQ